MADISLLVGAEATKVYWEAARLSVSISYPLQYYVHARSLPCLSDINLVQGHHK